MKRCILTVTPSSDCKTLGYGVPASVGGLLSLRVGHKFFTISQRSERCRLKPGLHTPDGLFTASSRVGGGVQTVRGPMTKVRQTACLGFRSGFVIRHSDS